jgi:hypothetical protein
MIIILQKGTLLLYSNNKIFKQFFQFQNYKTKEINILINEG